ncbi:sugar-phosphatase [Celerinatantimonas sp. YJH-8]|uniref:sugar-phosphatase n=1 Tax=Celerinatantimonas sp. YJH-8 TaxID=3228714 RepID=UPI0038C293F4
MYRLIALDIDGTILNSDKQISPRTIAAIQAASQAGVHVVLASGRPLDGILMHLETLGLTSEDQYVVSYNGGLVQRISDGKVLCSQLLHGSDTKKLGRLAQQLGVHTHAFSLSKGLITPQVSRYTEHEAFMNDIPWTTFDYESLDDDEPIMKVMLIDEPDILEDAISKIPERYYQDYTILRSSPFFLEFMNIHTNKGAGVAALADYLSIPSQQVICIGDAGNDHHMIRWAGLGVAMGNADPQTQALADYVTLSNDQDGVAHVIEKFVLNGTD